jgi:glycosyltransferase involved in cell wall biosynthesis
MDFSIIIPAFNEKTRLPQFLVELVNEISIANINCEIIIVDDGSAEDHYQIYLKSINRLSQVPINIIRHSKNMGKGASILSGFKKASGTWIGFIDADGATSPKDVLRILNIALPSDELDGVFASRIRMLGFNIERPFLRHLSGRIFATLTGVLLNIPIYDSQCGCKFFRKSKILPYLNLCKEQGYLFDIELISICYFKKLNLLEIPINWADQPGGKVNLINDGFKMAVGIFRIRERIKKMGIM